MNFEHNGSGKESPQLVADFSNEEPPIDMEEALGF